MITKTLAARLVAEGKAKHDAKANTVTIDAGILGVQLVQVTAADIEAAKVAIEAEHRDEEEQMANELQEIERLKISTAERAARIEKRKADKSVKKVKL